MAAGEDFEAQVTAALGPFMVLLGEDRPDQADGASGREAADDVGAAANYRLSRSEGLWTNPAPDLLA